MPASIHHGWGPAVVFRGERSTGGSSSSDGRGPLMPRIRAVHPDLPSDYKLSRLSRDVRYTYVLLWCIADDKGLFRAEPRQLAGQLYPYDSEVDGSHLEAWLSDLVSIGVLRWRTDRAGARIGELVNWLKRQRIDRPSKSYLEGELTSLAPGSQPPREDGAPELRGARDGLDPRSLESRVLSPEPRVLSPESGAALRARLPPAYHEVLDGFLRAAPYPAAVVSTILAEGPDTGTNGAPGKTWELIGQSLLELRAAGKPFTPVLLRAFIRKLLEVPPGPSLTDAERMRQAREQLERDGAA